MNICMTMGLHSVLHLYVCTMVFNMILINTMHCMNVEEDNSHFVSICT